jgi:hypothetical protein
MSITWHTERRVLAELKDHPKNPRITTNLAALEKSIDRNGYFDPIVINLDETVLSGHRRKWILIGRVVVEEDVRVPDRLLTEKEAEPILIEANKAIAGAFDFEILSSEFEIEDLKDYGFTDYDLKIADLLRQGQGAGAKDQESGWTGLPAYDSSSENPQLIVNFAVRSDMELFAQKMGVVLEKKNRNSYTCWWPVREKKDLTSVKFEDAT